MEKEAYNMITDETVTVDVCFSNENTTWFQSCGNEDIHMITDTQEGLLITELGDFRPMLIPGKTRNDICFDKQKAGELRAEYY